MSPPVITSRTLGDQVAMQLGIKQLQPGQGREVVFVMLTGSGKSICFQRPRMEVQGISQDRMGLMFQSSHRRSEFSNSRHSVAAGIVAFVIILFGGNLVEAQQPYQGAPFPFQFGPNGNPEKMFEAMFGPGSPEEEKALAAEKISFADERAFGQKILDGYLADLKLKKLRVIRKGGDVEYLQKLIETIHPLMINAGRYKQFTVCVIDSDEVDARSIPGGTLLFSTGLLKFARSEAALIGIVGHELSHLDREHQLLPLKRTKILDRAKFALTGNFDPQKLAVSGTTMIRLMGRPFRPEDESAADHDGAEWAFRAGYDPRELASLFTQLHLKNKDQKVAFGNFFRTHPYNEDRSAAISVQYEAMQKQNPTNADLYIGTQNIKKRVAKSVHEFAE